MGPIHHALGSYEWRARDHRAEWRAPFQDGRAKQDAPGTFRECFEYVFHVC